MCIVRYLLCNCVYHPERGSAISLMKTSAQWESCRHSTVNKGAVYIAEVSEASEATCNINNY